MTTVGQRASLTRIREAWVYYRNLREMYGHVGYSRRYCLYLVRRFWGSLV